MPLSKNYPQITIFTTSNCPYCYALMSWLEAQNIPYQTSDAAKSNFKTAPIIKIHETIIVGFDRPAIKKALKNYAAKS